eukprot:GILJ01001611.1.p1 GENE.GILJ01001611.1~~GILJ01001611.1.p1  ORF type:complete len:126 (-),score=24.41 GILJ01001611.1:103-480(-)
MASLQNDEIDVTAEDQTRINAFSRANARFHELEDDIRNQKELKQNFEDAQQELMLGEGSAKLLIGEAYMDVTEDTANEFLEGQIERTQAELDRLSGELDSVRSVMSTLKGQLYARFGNNINLEEE